ncbi:MAG: YheU family protein, partial [Gammaproteobacteria bacterium]|nr:YheU family protein [Gammaproteobacteria bacterium]
MIIPYTELDTATLNSLVESFILREGTDYGNNEVSLDKKTEQILEQIYSKKI